jgi:hypothetical protein
VFEVFLFCATVFGVIISFGFSMLIVMWVARKLDLLP